MAEITKVYKQSVGAMRFIGKKYGDNDRVDGNFGAKWGEWFENSWFDTIEKQIAGSLKDVYEDGDAYIGLLRNKSGEPYQYWIGMFTPENTEDTGGYEVIDFPGGLYAVVNYADNDAEGAHKHIQKWVEESGCFTPDDNANRHFMWHFISTEAAKAAMGYYQYDFYFPIRIMEGTK